MYTTLNTTFWPATTLQCTRNLHGV